MSTQAVVQDFETVLATVVSTNGRRGYREALEPRREFSSGATASAPIGSFIVLSVGQGWVQEQELLAEPGTALHELYSIVTESGVSPCFPAAVQSEVDAWLAEPGLADSALHDLEALPFVTIDGKHSRDLDQALFLAREQGRLTVYYAIADASYYIQPGTELFAEAMRRGASFYLPGLVVPMLPKPLSEGLVSLNPGVTRRAIVFVTQLGPDGKVFDTTIRRARVKSRAKLHFEQVQAFYDSPHTSELSHAEFASSLDLLREFADLRSALAREQNVVRYRRAEIEAQLSPSLVRRFVVTRAVRKAVEGYNEQLSLLCNSEGARLLELASERPLIEPIFRIHPPPESEPTEAFRAMTQRLASLHGVGREWVWHGEQALARYLAALPAEPRALSEAIARQAVMLNVGSSFQSTAASHFGVGSKVYARFSAPMREIVGIYLHRELTQALGHAPQDDDALRDAVIARANLARQLQKRMTNACNLLILDQVFNDHLTPSASTSPLWASVVGLSVTKVHVTLENPPIDAKVHLADLRRVWGQSTRVSRDSCEVLVDGQSRVRLGDRIQLRVFGHDQARKHWHLGIDGTS